MKKVEITAEEQKAIKSLKRLAKNFPKSLNLFCFVDTLNVTKIDDGEECLICQIDGIDIAAGDPSFSELTQNHNLDIKYL